jgi:hypothetical protein
MPPASSRRWYALRARGRALHERHARAFWLAHSLWALAQGALVGVVAEERPDFAAWVLGLLALVWGSTVFFCRSALVSARPESLRVGAASYATRVIYQQTLFFLLPFYVRSTTPASPNLAFTLALAALALLACLDLAFDRLLRRSAAFAATFFFAVAYAALQLLLPLALRVPYSLAQPLALGLALASALASVGLPRSPERAARMLGALPAGALALILLAAPLLVPPAPLRLAALALEPSALGVRATARIASPVSVPVDVTLRWEREGELLRTTRDIEITAHRGGFRVWDELSRARFDSGHGGRVRVELVTATGQLLGRGTVYAAGS